MNLICKPPREEGKQAPPLYRRVTVIKMFDLGIAGEVQAFALHETIDQTGHLTVSHYETGLSINQGEEFLDTFVVTREEVQRLLDRKVGERGSEWILQRIYRMPRVNFPHEELNLSAGGA